MNSLRLFLDRYALTPRRLAWVGLGVATLVVQFLLSVFPVLGEKVYGHMVFPMLREVFYYTLGQLPFAAMVLVILLVVRLLWMRAIRPLITGRWTAWSFLCGTLSTVCALLFLFQSLWGFNYSRESVDARLDISLQGLTAEELGQEFGRATNELKAAAGEISDLEVLNQRAATDHERSVRSGLQRQLISCGYNLVAAPRVRVIIPKGLLMRWNTAGIYVPFVGEGHVDAGMLPVQLPFTIAHEMAHGYGVTDEGDCNFLAYLACRQSKDPYVQFAGVLTYWRYVASEYRRVSPEVYAEHVKTLPDLVIRTLLDIRENDARYPDLLPKLRNAVYDSYLKTQGVKEGLLSYNRVVQLAYRYHEKYGLPN